MDYVRSEAALGIANQVREYLRPEIAPYGRIIPVPIEQLACDWGVRVFSPLWTVKYQGLSRWMNGRHYVAINGRLPHTAQRFTLAHEIVGHGILHRDRLASPSWDSWASDPKRWVLEIEANTAAAEFLLPFEWLRQQMTVRFENLPLSPDTFVRWIESRDAQTLATEARVSRSVLGHHICDLQWAGTGSREQWLAALATVTAVHPAAAVP